VYLTLLLTTLLAPPPDTTFAVRQGQRLAVSARRGSITIKAWPRDEVRVTSDAEHADAVRVEASGSQVTVSAGGRGSPAVDIVLWMPAWMPVAASGAQADITVDGCACPIQAETVSGDILVRGGKGNVDLQAVEGGITATDITGRVNAQTVNDDVHLSRITGEVRAETVNGDVTLAGVQSGSVRASTVDGDVRYAGSIQDQGVYELATHNGDILVTMGESTNAAVTVNTFSGSFESEFPVTVAGRSASKFTFTLGKGSARVTLESFAGDIRLVRPGSSSALSSDHGDDDE